MRALLALALTLAAAAPAFAQKVKVKYDRHYDFGEIESLQAAGKWDEAGRLLAADARRLQNAGADLIVLCTNTMHLVADAIEAAVDVPFVHLADTTAAAVIAAGLDTVGLLGTRFTMEKDFYRGRLEEHGLQVIVPEEPDLTTVHNVIYDELVQGIVRDESRSTSCSRIRSAPCPATRETSASI